MALTTEFKPLPLSELRREAAVMKADGWRFIQTHAVNTDDGIDLYYSFMRDGHVANYCVQGVQKGTPVPSITDLFLAAFVFENEARELFGVDMRDIAIDFAGAMYAPAESEPMTFMSPEQKAARDKARAKAQKAAAAQAAPEAAKTDGEEGASAQQAVAPAGAKRVFVMTPELQARLDAKLPTLSDEKRAKVEAALKARAAEAEAAAGEPAAQAEPAPQAEAAEKAEDAAPKPAGKAPQASANAEAPAAEPAKAQDEAATPAEPLDAALAHHINLLSPDKAAKVRAAFGLEGGEAAQQATESTAAAVAEIDDEQVAALLNSMDDAKAAIVRAAFAAKGGE